MQINSIALICFLGACEGSLACSTCHVILEAKYFEMLPDPQIEEEDMLDLAFGLTRTYKHAAPSLSRVYLFLF